LLLPKFVSFSLFFCCYQSLFPSRSFFFPLFRHFPSKKVFSKFPPCMVWYGGKKKKHRDRESFLNDPFGIVWYGGKQKETQRNTEKHREHSFRTASLVCYGSKEKEKQRKLNFLFTRPINFVVLKLSVCFFFFLPYHTIPQHSGITTKTTFNFLTSKNLYKTTTVKKTKPQKFWKISKSTYLSCSLYVLFLITEHIKWLLG